MNASMTDSFRQAMLEAGVKPPIEIIADGRLHRFAANGNPDDDAGWYVFHDDGLPAGEFGDWRTGIKQTWSARNGAVMSDAERAAHRARVDALRRRGEEEERSQHAEAAACARQLWESAMPATDIHPYLSKKRVPAYGLRVHRDGRLIAPLCDADGALWSLEFIADDGSKRFLSGGHVAGCFYLIGEVQDRRLCIAEGFATAASVHAATGHPTAVAFFAGNLEPVAKALRAKYPDSRIVICGDHDVSGTGQTKAREVAGAVAGVVAIPAEAGTDWNDVAVQYGLEAVRTGMAAALNPHHGILQDIYAFLGRFIAYPAAHAHVAHTLWIAHAHLMDAWESTPRLAFLSPEPGSGKTRALEITETLTPRPVEAINATPAYLFRKVNDPAGLPTILHDEIDSLFGPRAKEHEEIRAIINAGHRRGAMAGRCVVKGKVVETEELPAYCAVAMAGLGNLPDTILTRSVIVKMRRRAPGEQVEPYRRRLHASEGWKLRERLSAWAAQIRPTLNPYPDMPEGITDRNADVWEALLSIADAAGGEWPDRARVAAVALVADAKRETPSLGIRLLADIRGVFAGAAGSECSGCSVSYARGTHEQDALATHDLLTSLHALEEAPWGDLKGKPLDSRRLANLLKPYGIQSKKIRIGDKTAQGYERTAFYDAWGRYLPTDQGDAVGVPDKESGTSGTSGTNATSGGDLFTEEVVDLGD